MSEMGTIGIREILLLAGAIFVVVLIIRSAWNIGRG